MNDTHDALDVVLHIALQRQLDEVCPVDPERAGAVPVLPEDVRRFSARNTRVLQQVEQELAEPQAKPAYPTLVDKLRALVASPQLVTLYRKPNDTSLSDELDEEIEGQIREDLEKDKPDDEP